MRIARVIDAVWPAARSPGLEGRKLLRIRVLGFDGSPAWSLSGAETEGLAETAQVVVAADELDAGPGDLVLVAQGSRTRDLTVGRDMPTKTVILAVLDGGGGRLEDEPAGNAP